MGASWAGAAEGCLLGQKGRHNPWSGLEGIAQRLMKFRQIV
jgi:hypothetical protein